MRVNSKGLCLPGMIWQVAGMVVRAMNNSGDDEALLSAILEAAVDAIVISDETGTILRANPAARELFQYSEDALIGHNVSKLMPKDFASQHDGYMRRFVETGEKRVIGIGRDVEGLRKDGTVFPLHLSVGHTKVTGKTMFVGILHDLTTRKTAQAALFRSQRLDAVGQMTGGIAHDFNNLLTIIIGNLELLEMRGADGAQATLIKEALEAAEMGSDLTSRLMVFARRSNLHPVKADLRSLCDETLAILKRTLGAQIHIKTDFAEEISLVTVDAVQLQSALMNLALNARDAMNEKGELLISIADVCIDDDYMAQEIDVETGDYVRLSVSDDGAGMTEEAQKHAFEPFFTTKPESGGTGLGLATVYGFVRQSGGHITLYSEEGLGTSFGLYFPALAEKSGARSVQAVENGNRQPPFGQGRTVLVVEDNTKVRRLSVDRIRDLGFHVEEAESGDQAYAMLKGGLPVDVLFSDLVMPGSMNGYELAERVATEFPHIKVMLTSGYASDVVTTRMARGQVYEILHKPYRQSELVLRLQALISGS